MNCYVSGTLGVNKCSSIFTYFLCRATFGYCFNNRLPTLYQGLQGLVTSCRSFFE